MATVKIRCGFNVFMAPCYDWEAGKLILSVQQASVVNVEFEWFDPQPEHDFHGLKTLLRQLFDVDAEIFDLSALTDLILAQPLLGSTVKVEGNESDPFAFLTVLNLHEHRVRMMLQIIFSSRSSSNSV